MARSKASLSARLKKLRAAKQRIFSLPRGQTLTAVPMAKMLGVTWSTLRDWCNEIEGFAESGAFDGGAEGIEYEFCPVRTVWFLIEHLEREVNVAAERDAKFNNAIGIQTEEGDFAESHEERRWQINTSITVSAAEERQGNMAKVNEVIEMYSRSYMAWRDGIMSIPTEIDPNGNFPAKVRDEMDHRIRVKLAAGEAAVEQEEKKFRARSKQEAVGR